MHRHEVGSPQPQGSSLLPELCCLEPSSLNRPHPSHSWAHRIFTAWRLIPDAFAVRERRGDPRVVPGFRYPFCPGIPSSPTPGSSISVSSSAAMSTRPLPRVDRLGTPAIRFTRAMTFVASWFTHLLRSASLLAPCTDLTGCPASGAFTSVLPAGWSPFPLQDITTTATGLLCWRDSHPLEWQLASLHLLLHRDGLAPSTPCRSPGALRFTPDSRTSAVRRQFAKCQNRKAAYEEPGPAGGSTARNSMPCRLIVGHIPKWLPPNTLTRRSSSSLGMSRGMSQIAR